MKANRIPPFRKRLFAAVCLFSAARIWAFGELGHRVIAALAEDMLTPKAEAQVKALLVTEGGPGSLAAASTWADEIRVLRPATRPWHYITLQISDSRPDIASADSPNVVTALERELAVLARPGSDRYAREEALKWVAHLAGDLHQPLHAGEDHDKGGNLAKVRVNRRAYALHAVWDYVLLERLRLPQDSLKAMLEREIASEPGWIARNVQGTPADWALQTHALAPACYRIHGKPLPKGRQAQLDREYVRAATLASLLQIKRAGARLAFLLNRAFDPGAGPPSLRAPPGAGPAVPDYFAAAGEIGGEAGAGKSAPAAGPGESRSAKAAAGRAARGKRSRPPRARYAWSVNSKVYHYSECADVKRIAAKNLETSDVPPQGKSLHTGCPAR